MTARLRRLLVLGLALLTIPLWSSGCSKSTSPKTTNRIGGGGSADSLVALANAQLEDILYAQINSASPTRPSDLDYSAPEQLYRSALAADPANADANFGVGVLGLMSLTVDPAINAAFDTWNTYLKDHVPFEVPTGQQQVLGVRTTLTSGVRGLRLPFQIVPLSLVADLRAGQAAVDPQLSVVQDILATRALPKLLDAVARLGVAAAKPGYVFEITPRMQGDNSAPPILVHANDLIALRAGAQLLAAAVEVATAYDLNFASYDSTGLVAALRPGSSWLALVGSGGATGVSRLADARTRLQASIVDAQSVLSTLLTQTGDHDQDLVKIPPGPRGRAEVESLQVHLATASQALTAGYTWTGDWDDNGQTPDVPLTIRVDRFFGMPIHDLKALLPAYGATAVRRPLALRYNSDYIAMGFQVSLPSAGYYSGSYSVSRSSVSDTGTVYSSGNGAIVSVLRTKVRAEAQRIVSLPGFGGYCYVDGYFSGYCVAGVNSLTADIWESYVESSSIVFAPALVWNAGSFATWVWPDPTLGGVLPGITTNSQFLSTFGFTADHWEKTQVLDWTQLGPYGW